MFIIPTWLLKEKSMMVPLVRSLKTYEILSEVDVKTIEKILSLEKKFTDFIDTCQIFPYNVKQR